MIQFQHVRKSFDNLLVLRDVNLTIEDGLTTAIIGGSGCGKSVLLKHIIGLLKPDGGAVLVDDLDTTKVPYPLLVQIRKKISMVFQGSALFDSMSIGENMGMGLKRHTRLKDREIKSAVSEALEMVDLRDIEHKFPAELSGGMKKPDRRT